MDPLDTECTVTLSLSTLTGDRALMVVTLGVGADMQGPSQTLECCTLTVMCTVFTRCPNVKFHQVVHLRLVCFTVMHSFPGGSDGKYTSAM